MATSEQVLDAASVLATFRSVSGDTFKRAIGYAQDMATVFGGDVTTAAKQLGKALQDPEVGITALNRVRGDLHRQPERPDQDAHGYGRRCGCAESYSGRAWP